MEFWEQSCLESGLNLRLHLGVRLMKAVFLPPSSFEAQELPTEAAVS